MFKSLRRKTSSKTKEEMFKSLRRKTSSKTKDEMFKSLKRKNSKTKEEQIPLVRNNTPPIQHAKTSDAGENESSSMASGSGVEVSGEEALDILRNILSDQSNPEDLDQAAEVLKRWSKLNGVTINKREGSFPQNWLCEYLQVVDQFVEKHIPTLPVEGAPGSSQFNLLQDFLKNTECMISNEVHRLTPVLEDAGLLVHLTDTYSRQLLTQLDLLLNRDLSVKETFCLLQCGKNVFFSSDSKLRMYDLLLLTGWFERAKQKLLVELQKEISKTLQNILCYDEKHGNNKDLTDEETFIKLHIDVIKLLNAAISEAKDFSLTLMHAVQILCSEELHDFVQKYVDTENKCLQKQKFTEKNSIYLFWIINTCMQLRCCATQISPGKNNSDVNSSTISMLKELENKALSIVQNIITCLAQANLKMYFKTNNVDIDVLTDEIHRQCASLPQTASEIKMIVVKTAYDCVSKVYLEHLMKTKFRKLENLWGDAEKKIREDVQRVHKTFSELNSDVAQKNQLLQRMSEVSLESDVEALKITCGVLYRDFPHESKQYVPGLLRWRLSERQVREVLDAIGDLYPNHSRVTCSLGLCPCLGAKASRSL